MLTERTERELYRQVHHPISALQTRMSVDLFMKAVKSCYSVIDTFVSSMQKIGVINDVACQKGCSFCCYLPVSAYSYEIVALAHHIQTSWSEPELKALKKRIRQYIKHSSFIRPFVESKEIVYCPLLKDHSCMVYSIRPINCQAHHSSDAGDCEDAMHGKPSILDFNSLWGDVHQIEDKAMFAAFNELGLDTSRHNLVVGLKTALDTPDVAEAYLQGRRLF